MSDDKKQIILNCEKLETRVALLNKGKLEEYEIQRESNDVTPGSVYLGRIMNLEPTLQAAFVDIGADKNAFLHYWDMLPASYDMMEKVKKDDATPEKKRGRFSEKLRKLFGRGQKRSRMKEIQELSKKKKITVKDIPNLFPVGSEILVQITKGPIGNKGPRVTTNLTIPGRYLVLLPYADQLGMSTKIDDKKERDRLKKIIKELDVPEGMGLICRTVAEGRKSVFFKRDLDMLLEHWHRVEQFLERPKVPALVYSEPTLIERTARDLLTDDIDEIIADDHEAYKTLQSLLGKIMGRKFASKVVLHKKAQPIFEYYRVQDQIAQIFHREVPLTSGGYLCVDETEALVAIDINTGKSRAKKDQPETILATNLEAAEEVARQLKLRNIGGLVVIDFIDMRSRRDRDKVNRLMRKLVRNDRARTKLLPISQLGLMQMTRQREHESLKDAVYDSCPYCNGTGRIKSCMSMSVEIQRRLQEVLKRYQREKDISIRVIMHPSILARLKNEDARLLDEMEAKYGKNLSFRADASVHHEEFKLVDPETGAEFR